MEGYYFAGAGKLAIIISICHFFEQTPTPWPDHLVPFPTLPPTLHNVILSPTAYAHGQCGAHNPFNQHGRDHGQWAWTAVQSNPNPIGNTMINDRIKFLSLPSSSRHSPSGTSYWVLDVEMVVPKVAASFSLVITLSC